MNLELVTQFNLQPFLILLLLGVALFFIFQLMYRFLIYFISSKKIQLKVLSILPILERISWGIFGVLAAVSLIIGNFIIGGLIVILLIGATWSFIKNYLSGVLMLLSSDYKIGQHIQIGDYKGKIKAFKSVRCFIKLDNGETLILPYNQFISKEVLRTHSSEKMINHTLLIHVNKPADFMKEQKKIYQKVIGLPWIVMNSKPKIELKEETENAYVFSVIIQVIDKEHIQRIEQFILAS